MPQIIADGRAIRLLDAVPGTDKISISDFRGHIGQIFREDLYSAINSELRAVIHTQLLDYLRDPQNYIGILQDILCGKAVDFGPYGKLSLPLAPYNHTYWIDSDSGSIYCLKTYPSPDKSAGVTFNEGPDLLFAFAEEYGFGIRNAYIGANGKDVGTRLIQNNTVSPIRYTLDGADLGEYLINRGLANFIAFLTK